MSEKNMSSFLAAVGEQIRWKRARAPLLYELETHICERRDHLIDNGADFDEAEARAVAEMGNPEDIGLELNRVHRPQPNWAIIACGALLLLLGILMLWAVGDREEYLDRMLVYSGIGIAALVAGYFLDYTLLAKIPPAAHFILCGICIVLPMIGFISLSAQICYILPLFYAILVYRARSGAKKDTAAVLAGMIMCYAAAVFSHHWIALTTYISVTCIGILLFAAGKKWFRIKKWYIYSFAIGLPLVIFTALCLSSPLSMSKRISAVFSPDQDPLGYGWLPMRLREIFSTSRFFGEGATSEHLEIFLKPNQLTSIEYTLAAATHKFGLIVFVGLAIITVIVGLLIVRGLRRHSCYFGKLVVIAIGLGFLVRTVGYFMYNLGFSLTSFEGMPLFSYCGKLMIFDMFVMGILLSVFRAGSIARDSRIKLRA